MSQPDKKQASLNVPIEVLQRCRDLASRCGYMINAGPNQGMGNLVALLRTIAKAYSADPERVVAMLQQLIGHQN